MTFTDWHFKCRAPNSRGLQGVYKKTIFFHEVKKKINKIKRCFLARINNVHGDLLYYPRRWRWRRRPQMLVFVMFLSHLLVAGCDIGVRFSVRPSVRQSVRPSVSPSVRLSTFMSTFDIYVKVSILINCKTKQPSNLAWNISLTSWLCNIGIRFSVCLSIRPSFCQHLCRSSTFMSVF